MYRLDESALISEIQALIPDIKLIYIFGSYAQGTQHQHSDLDIAIFSSKALDNVTRWQIAQSLAARLDVDVDLIDLHKASTVLCQQILTQGKRLWGSQIEDDRFAVKTMSMYQHLQQERAMILKDFKRLNSKGNS